MMIRPTSSSYHKRCTCTDPSRSSVQVLASQTQQLEQTNERPSPFRIPVKISRGRHSDVDSICKQRWSCGI
ncbi:unnamed protein product [Mycena citricolor]|uniref:Uncharacterized protein n=1 Tax=Mycena citricolor TaxID=2018698 RepID=A0AAD2Q4H0_9AGAR|nr:unnamed protein product [Mycena citricolor]